MGNIATVQSIYQAFGQGDIPAILDKMSEDVDWEAWDVDHTAQEAGVPWFLRRSGRAGVGEFFQALAENLEVHSFEPRSFLEGGDQVAATISIEFTATATGERFKDQEVHLWTFGADGKVTSFRHYLDTAKQVRAMKGSAAVA